MQNKEIIKFWGLTILLGPIVYFMYFFLHNDRGTLTANIEDILLIVVFSIILSIPTLISLFILNKIIKLVKTTKFIKRFFLLILTLIGIIGTLKIINGSIIQNLSAIYCITTITSFIIIELTTYFKNKNLSKTQM